MKGQTKILQTNKFILRNFNTLKLTTTYLSLIKFKI